MGAGLRTIATAGAWLAIACGAGRSQTSLDGGASELACLTPLTPYCCGGSAPRPCIGNFAAAERCAAWPAGTAPLVFASACEGMTAVRVDTSYSTFYLYDSSGALVAVGDNATSPDPASGDIACGAGPGGFVVAAACAPIWEGSGGAPCATGTAAPVSLCR
jgi:hypothetical protein